MRNEYPRPDFVREQWKSLNGTWDFYEGLRAGKLQIEVPFVPQSRLSGIGRTLTSDEILYERQFTVPREWEGKRILLHFGAVDYRCSVWVNGQCAGTHQGGQTPFTFDITDFLNGVEEHLRVSAVDYLSDEGIPGESSSGRTGESLSGIPSPAESGSPSGLSLWRAPTWNGCILHRILTRERWRSRTRYPTTRRIPS